MSEAIGIPFDADIAESQAGRLSTLYFRDIQTATSPRFDHISVADFTRQQIAAHSAMFGDDERPYVHVDQLFEFWLHVIIHIWSIRAFYTLTPKNQDGLNSLMRWALDVRSDPVTHRDVADDMLHVYAKYGEALQISHQLTVAGMAFIICHELAHHELLHIGKKPSQELEFEADRAGFQILRQVLSSEHELEMIKGRPFSLASVWIVLQIIDLSERRLAQRAGKTHRLQSKSHPLAETRISRLLPMLESEANPDVDHFIEGYGEALEQIKQNLCLSDIE